MKDKVRWIWLAISIILTLTSAVRPLWSSLKMWTGWCNRLLYASKTTIQKDRWWIHISLNPQPEAQVKFNIREIKWDECLRGEKERNWPQQRGECLWPSYKRRKWKTERSCNKKKRMMPWSAPVKRVISRKNLSSHDHSHQRGTRRTKNEPNGGGKIRFKDSHELSKNL